MTLAAAMVTLCRESSSEADPRVAATGVVERAVHDSGARGGGGAAQRGAGGRQERGDAGAGRVAGRDRQHHVDRCAQRASDKIYTQKSGGLEQRFKVADCVWTSLKAWQALSSLLGVST